MRHKAREMLVTQRTQLLNGLRGHLTEVGVIAAQGPRCARELAELIEACDETVPFEVCEALAPLVGQSRNLDEAIARLDRTIVKMARKDETARRLMSIPGFGPITASAMAATVQDASGFAGPRELAAFLGLTPSRTPRAASRSSGASRRWAIGTCANCSSGRPCGAVSPQTRHRSVADVGEEADRQETFQARRRGARQQDGAHRLRDPAEHDSSSGNSGVRSVGEFAARGSPRAGRQRN